MITRTNWIDSLQEVYVRKSQETRNENSDAAFADVTVEDP